MHPARAASSPRSWQRRPVESGQPFSFRLVARPDWQRSVRRKKVRLTRLLAGPSRALRRLASLSKTAQNRCAACRNVLLGALAGHHGVRGRRPDAVHRESHHQLPAAHRRYALHASVVDRWSAGWNTSNFDKLCIKTAAVARMAVKRALMSSKVCTAVCKATPGPAARVSFGIAMPLADIYSRT